MTLKSDNIKQLNMKFFKNFILVFSLVLTFGCTKEDEVKTEKVIEEEQNEEVETVEEPEPFVYFTYNATALNDSERWIIVYDSDGNLLDYKQDLLEGPMTFTAHKDSIPEKINITKLSYNKFNDGISEGHRLLTFTDIDDNSVWNDNNYNITGNLIGTFNFQVRNITEYETFQISTPYNILRPDEFSSESNDNKITLQLTNIPLYENMEYWINVRGENGRTKFLKLSPANGESYIHDFNDFLEFDEYVPINLPSNQFYILQSGGFSSNESNTYWGDGQSFSEFFGNGEGMPENSFLNGYDRYKFGLGISFIDYSYGYYKIGDKVLDITIPEKPSFTMVSQDIYNLEFVTELNPVTKTTRHNSEKTNEEGAYLTTDWEVFSTGSKTQQIYELPNELIERFPNMELEDLNLNTVILYTQGYEQQQFFIDKTSKIRTGNYISENYTFNKF